VPIWIGVEDSNVPADGEPAALLPWVPATSEATTMHADTRAPRVTPRAVRTLMVVGREPDERVLASVTDTGGYDVIVMEPFTTAYSRIKRFAPSVVILSMEIDDVEACQLISMLKLDRDTSRIPVFTCLAEPAPAPSFAPLDIDDK
jgi:PleD family two-component response regulator